MGFEIIRVEGHIVVGFEVFVLLVLFAVFLVVDDGWDEVLLVVSLIKKNLSLWVIGDGWLLLDGGWDELAAENLSEPSIKVMEVGQGQDADLVSTSVVSVALDDALAGSLNLGVSVVDCRKDKTVEDVHDQDVSEQPPDEDVSSSGSVALSEDLLSLLVINDNVKSFRFIGWSISP